MFEVGFSEIAVIAVIALIVLGPERLPKAARMAGTFLRKARRSFESLKLEVERELEADELKKQFAQLTAAPAAFANELQQPFGEAKAALEHNVEAAVQSAKAAFADFSTPAEINTAANSVEASTDLVTVPALSKISGDDPKQTDAPRPGP